MNFRKLRYEVVAIDASQMMVEATTRLTGRSAYRMQFEEMDFENQFDGVWACASLLHVPRAQIDDVLNRIERALRPRGVCYMSFKEGEGDRMDGKRQFTDFTTTNLKASLAGHTDLEIVRIWITKDERLRQDVQWVNALVRKRVTL